MPWQRGRFKFNYLNYHIGNLRLQPMQVKNGEWVQVPWESKRPSDILERYH